MLVSQSLNASPVDRVSLDDTFALAVSKEALCRPSDRRVVAVLEGMSHLFEQGGVVLEDLVPDGGEQPREVMSALGCCSEEVIEGAVLSTAQPPQQRS